MGLEEAGDLRVAQPGPLLGLLADRGGIGAEIDDRRRDVLPLAVGDHLRPPVAIAMRHDRVGGAQVDADEGGHGNSRILSYRVDIRGKQCQDLLDDGRRVVECFLELRGRRSSLDPGYRYKVASGVSRSAASRQDSNTGSMVTT